MKHFNNVIVMIILLALAVCSCKDKDKNEEVETYSTSTTNALVLSFSLQNSKRTTAKLDSVHFTIDPVRGQIYNVDSLPVGTDVSSVLTTVSFRSSIRNAKYYLTYSKSGVVQRDTITYSSTSTDSLNFTGTARLEVTSYDGTTTRSYDIHINVHKSEPDTLTWPLDSRRNLPGAGDDNVAQRTVRLNNVVMTLLHNNTGYHLSTAYNAAGPWETNAFKGDFVPDVNSFTANESKLYLLDTDGNLYTSDDGELWTATGERWRTIIGGYSDRVLGITADEQPMLDEYPRPNGYVPRDVPAAFPISGLSQLVSAENNWAVSQQAVMVGGVLADGSLSNKTWGYDGSIWAEISNVENTLPALRDAILVSYYTYNVSAVNYKATKQESWLLMGGFTVDGNANRTTYVSNNQGITWQKAATSMQWPSHIPSMGGAQAIIEGRTFTANGSPRRRVSQPVTEWEVPYIYLFGGYTSSGVLFNNIWCGVITRLTYKPVY